MLEIGQKIDQRFWDLLKKVPDEIKKIVRAIYSTFDMTSVLEAEKIYTKSPY